MPRVSPSPALLALTLTLACDPVKPFGDDTAAPVDDSSPVHTGDSSPDSEVPDTGCTDTSTDQPTWYRDADGDGYGRSGDSVTACEAPSTSFVAEAGDCDDEDATVYPGAAETCDSVDNDCDAAVDEDFDGDGDGYLNSACAEGTDCDDTDASVSPGATDDCGDGIDSDCSGADKACTYDKDLSDPDVKLYAESASSDAGRHMDVGDLDGDGVHDLVVGAMWADGYQGNTWVVPGPVSGESAFSDVGFKISGGSGAYESGRTVGVGDLSGDGYDDILIGSPDASRYDAVMVFGPVTEDLSFQDADFKLSCEPSVECGHGGDVADLDGDGQMDALVAAGEYYTGGYYSGSVFLFFGPIDSGSADMLSTNDGELVGASASSETGRIISAGGDLDGDGVSDALITASYDSEGGPYAGAVHVLLGPVEGGELSDSDGKLLGVGAYDYAGEGLNMGDIDGDGNADALVGALSGSSSSGSAYVTLGPATGTISLSDAEIHVKGDSSETMGASLDGVDIDGDGNGDLLVGASTNADGRPASGAAYVFMGPLSGTLAGDDAFQQFTGNRPNEAAGSGVFLDDLDDNGEADLLIGAPGDATGGSSAGALNVIYSFL